MTHILRPALANDVFRGSLPDEWSLASLKLHGGSYVYTPLIVSSDFTSCRPWLISRPDRLLGHAHVRAAQSRDRHGCLSRGRLSQGRGRVPRCFAAGSARLPFALLPGAFLAAV